MSFPRPHEGKVSCIGFPEKYLPAIQRAVENNQVEWGKTSLLIDICTAEFYWVGCLWELEEMRETVCSISLIHGKPNEEDLTAAVLRG